jgi:arylsulfatase A-like enzyme
MKKNFTFILFLLLTISSYHLLAQRDPVLPFQGKLAKTLDQTQQSWPEVKKAPKNAPNVVYLVIDDVGYGASSAFGGLVETPNLEKLANNGLRYTNFHTNAICAPTRITLLTGRNSHSVHIGQNSILGTPGYDRQTPFEKATIAEILRENGYNTFAVGKWHLTAAHETTQAGPFNRWPTGRGFDHFYGFLSAATDQFHPQLWEDTHKIEIADDNKVLVSTRITDKAIQFIAEQKSISPDKPFFLYYAPGATHSPHQISKEWIDKYKGKFDFGWDKYRELVLERQKKLGVVPEYVQLPPSNPGVKKWDELSGDEKKLYLRFFEVYAGFFGHLDYEIGRLVEYLKDIDQFDNTLIYVSVGDNGASKEGTFVGVVGGPGSSFDPNASEEERLAWNVKHLDLIGTEFSSSNYPQGWAQAANTPFRYWKQDANSEGGTHNPLIIHWPNGIKEKGGIRNQYSHVNDITPTTIELVGATVPSEINGYAQQPFEGTSLAYSITEPKASSRHLVQYYEIKGSRSIYKDGWKAGALHVAGTDFAKDKWELFNLKEDFNERINLADKFPDKLKELQELFDSEAWKYNVYPLKDEFPGTLPPTKSIFDGRDVVVLYPGVSQIPDSPNLTNRSFSITADVEIPARGAEGVLFSNGGRNSGISLYVQSNKLQFVYNTGLEKYTITSDKPITPGKAQLKFNFDYAGENKGGTGSLYINDTKAGEAKFAKSSFRGAEGLSVGKDIITPVTDKYTTPYAFTGKLRRITLDFSAPVLGSTK